MRLENFNVRLMKSGDLEAITSIHEKVLGKTRPDYWELKIESVEKRSPIAPLVAEVEGKVVGFVIGGASGWEYGVPDNVGWIDTIGIDPKYQKQGLARLLMKEDDFSSSKSRCQYRVYDGQLEGLGSSRVF